MSLLRTSWLNFARALWEREAVEKLHEHEQGHVRWQGQWVQGDYTPHDIVRDGDWTMVCINPTSDKPAPEALGNPVWATDAIGGLTFSGLTSDDAVSVTGTRYYTSDHGILARGYRWWPPENSGNFTYELWTLNSAQGQLSKLFGPLIPTTSGAWIEVPWTALIPQGVTLDLALVCRSLTQPNTFTSNWQTKNENSNPGSGEAIFRNNQTEVRVSNTDKNDTNQEANLQAIEIGATMDCGGLSWVVTNITTNGSGGGGRHNFFISPAQGRPNENDQNITWSWGSTDPIPYVEDSNFYAGTSDIQGFSDDVYPPAALTENAHGVDLMIDEIVASEDWDLVAYSGLGIQS